MTYEECFETKEFIDFYRKELDWIWKQRKKQPNSDTYSQLGQMGMFQREKMTAEFLLINEKKSDLSSNQRAFIADLIMKCVFQTLTYFEEEKKQNKNVTK